MSPIAPTQLKFLLRSIAFCSFAVAISSASAGEIVAPKEAIEIPAPETPFDFSLTTAWDSRYVSEGRDNLDGDSLLSAELDAVYTGLPFGEILLGTWYGWTPASSAYAELNIFAEYGFELGNFGAYFGYNHLRFYPDDLHDNEIGAGISYNLPFGLTPGADWVYSFEADGSYFELYLEGEYEVAPWLVLAPAVSTGFNAGYVVDGHKGHNNVAISLAAAVPITENIEIGGYVAYTWGVNSDDRRFGDDESLENFFFGGAALTFSF